MIEYCTILLLETFLINQEQGQTGQIRGEIWKYFLLESTGDFFNRLFYDIQYRASYSILYRVFYNVWFRLVYIFLVVNVGAWWF